MLDEREYMRSDYRGRGSGNKTVWVILGIVGGVVLLVLLACGGLIYLAANAVRSTMEQFREFAEEAQQAAQDMQNSHQAAEQFLRDLQASRPKAAYQSASNRFRERWTQEEFEAFVGKHPGLKQRPKARDPGQPRAVPPGMGPAMDLQLISSQRDLHRYRYRPAFDPEGEGLELTITVVKDQGIWKVDDIQVNGEPE